MAHIYVKMVTITKWQQFKNGHHMGIQNSDDIIIAFKFVSFKVNLTKNTYNKPQYINV